MNNEQQKCELCKHTNATSHLEIINGKAECNFIDNILYLYDIKQDKCINTYIVCDMCLNQILDKAINKYNEKYSNNHNNIDKILIENKGYIDKNACQKLEIEFKKGDIKL